MRGRVIVRLDRAARASGRKVTIDGEPADETERQHSDGRCGGERCPVSEPTMAGSLLTARRELTSCCGAYGGVGGRRRLLAELAAPRGVDRVVMLIIFRVAA